MSVACPCCAGVESRVITRRVRGSDTQLRRCGDCRFEYLFPAPRWEQVRQMYTSDYYRSWGMADGETREVAEMKKATFRLRMREISRFTPPGRILDVGTASGFFMETAVEFGFEPFGVEFSEYSGRLAQQKFGAGHVWVGTLETAPFSGGFFDAVAMSDLLEHVLDPIGTLERARELLRPGGVLMVATPNTSSLTRRLMGTRWTHYKLEHLTYWNPAVLRRVAVQTGFEVLTIRPAWKVMTLRYLKTQFDTYPHRWLTPLAGALHAVAGRKRESHFRISMGEMVGILRRRDEPG